MNRAEIQAARDAVIKRSREEQGLNNDPQIEYLHQRLDGIRVRVDALEDRFLGEDGIDPSVDAHHEAEYEQRRAERERDVTTSLHDLVCQREDLRDINARLIAHLEAISKALDEPCMTHRMLEAKIRALLRAARKGVA